MGIKLDVSVETPLSDDDRDILAGISVMMLAIANRQNLAELAQQGEDGEEEQGEPMPCGSLNAKDEACVKEVAHPGRHEYRPFRFTGSTRGSPN